MQRLVAPLPTEEKLGAMPTELAATEANADSDNRQAALKVLCKELKATAFASTEGYEVLWDCATTTKEAYRVGRRNDQAHPPAEA